MQWSDSSATLVVFLLHLLQASKVPLAAEAGDGEVQQSSTKMWSERHGSVISFDEEPLPERKESEVSLLSSQLKDLETKAQETMYLQQELNDLNATLKVFDRAD